MSNEISSSHAYFLMEMEFSDDLTLMGFWEFTLDAIVDTDTSEAKHQVFAKRTSDAECVTSCAAQSTTFAQPPQGERVLEKPTSTQDVEKMATPDLPMWLVTVPCRYISPMNMVYLISSVSVQNILFSNTAEKEGF